MHMCSWRSVQVCVHVATRSLVGPLRSQGATCSDGDKSDLSRSSCVDRPIKIQLRRRRRRRRRHDHKPYDIWVCTTYMSRKEERERESEAQEGSPHSHHQGIPSTYVNRWLKPILFEGDIRVTFWCLRGSRLMAQYSAEEILFRNHCHTTHRVTKRGLPPFLPSFVPHHPSSLSLSSRLIALFTIPSPSLWSRQFFPTWTDYLLRRFGILGCTLGRSPL